MRWNVMTTVLAVAAGTLLWGCVGPERGRGRAAAPVRGVSSAPKEMTPPAWPTAAPARSAPDGEGASAVEKVILWSGKYAEAIEQLRAREATIHELQDANRVLEEKVTRLQNDLNSAQEELRDANEFLVQMRGEIDKWKNDVLGFREEMRQAQSAQMRALVQILRLLGAVELEPETQQTEPDSAEEAS